MSRNFAIQSVTQTNKQTNLPSCPNLMVTFIQRVTKRGQGIHVDMTCYYYLMSSVGWMVCFNGRVNAQLPRPYSMGFNIQSVHISVPGQWGWWYNWNVQSMYCGHVNDMVALSFKGVHNGSKWTREYGVILSDCMNKQVRGASADDRLAYGTSKWPE